MGETGVYKGLPNETMYKLWNIIQNNKTTTLEAAILLRAIQNDGFINTPQAQGMTLLMLAVLMQNPTMIELLLEHGADPSIQDPNGWSSLHYAVRSGNFAITKMLVPHVSDVNLQDSVGWSVLHFAVCGRHYDLVDMLIRIGVDLDLQDTTGWSALHHASHMGEVIGVTLLLQNGANAYLQNGSGSTPKDIAAIHNYLPISILFESPKGVA